VIRKRQFVDQVDGDQGVFRGAGQGRAGSWVDRSLGARWGPTDLARYCALCCPSFVCCLLLCTPSWVVAGRLSLSDVTLSPAARVSMEISGVGAGQYDQLVLGGNIALNGILEVQLSGDFVPQLGNRFELFDLQPGLILTGGFTQMVLPDAELGYWNTSDLLVTGSVALIPEPSAFMLGALASGLWALRRSKAR